MILVGIDPGLDGALASYCTDDAYVPTIHVQAMPTMRIGKRRAYDVPRLARMVDEYDQYGTAGSVLVVLEQVHAWPGQGVVSSYRLGYGVGLLEGIIAEIGTYRLEKVTPQRWRKVMLDGRPKGKASSVQRARELFPGVELKNREHGKAEALLLAEFGRRLYAR